VVIVAENDKAKQEEYQVLVKCQLESLAMPHFDGNHLNSSLREKRDVLPAGFQEPEYVNSFIFYTLFYSYSSPKVFNAPSDPSIFFLHW